MTLVVQPPNSTLIGFQPDSLRACWGVPCQGQLGPANRMAAGNVMWILAMVDGAQRAKPPGSHADTHSQHLMYTLHMLMSKREHIKTCTLCLQDAAKPFAAVVCCSVGRLRASLPHLLLGWILLSDDLTLTLQVE